MENVSTTNTTQAQSLRDVEIQKSLARSIGGGCSIEDSVWYILEENVVIPRARIPHATFNPRSATDAWTTHGESGPMSEPATMVPDAVTAWQMVYHWVSIALNVELVESEEARLARRRDELAREFADGVMGARTDYAGLPTTQRRAIDRIIALEGGANA